MKLLVLLAAQLRDEQKVVRPKLRLSVSKAWFGFQSTSSEKRALIKSLNTLVVK